MKVDFSKTTSTDLETDADRVGFNAVKALDMALEGLTDVQRSAVVAPPAPLLILAGAGTGKTKCLVSRIAYKIATGERLPSQVLAMTFTRKAASQMKRRLSHMIGPTAMAMDIGTFHATSARILRQFADFAGLDPHFTVYDADDQKACIKEILGSNEFSSDDILRNIERYKTDVCLSDGPWNVRGQYDQGFIDVEGFMIPKNAPHPKDAMKLVNLALDAKNQANFAAKIGYGPVNPKAFEVGILTKEQIAWLPTAPDNVKVQIYADQKWYASEQARAAYLRFSKFLQK